MCLRAAKECSDLPKHASELTSELLEHASEMISQLLSESLRHVLECSDLK